VHFVPRNWVISRKFCGFGSNFSKRPDLDPDLKGQCHEIFDLWFFSSNNPIWAPDSCCKIFSNFVANSPSYKQICVVLRYAGVAQDHDPALCGIARDSFIGDFPNTTTTE
jgi:hypothetical protein